MKSAFATVVIWIAMAEVAHADIVDLNDFYADPDVVVSPNGLSATLFESDAYSPVLLSYDPLLDGPPIVIPGAGRWLQFDYNFAESPLGDDEFGFFLFDASDGSEISGFEFFTDTSGSGNVAFDLTPLAGMTLGLQFQLSALLNDTDFGSQATVSNVQVATTVVPEPSTLALGLVAGTLALGGAVKRRFRAKASPKDSADRDSASC